MPQPFKNVVSMKLASIEIPNSWFLLSSLKKNNIFEIKTTICGNCNIYTIIIPEGNYTNDNIVSFLNSNFLYKSATDSPLKYIKFSVLENSNRSKFEIVENTPDSFTFSLIFTNGVIKEYPSKIKDCHNYLPIDDFYIDIVKNQNVVASFHSHLNSLTPSGNDLFFMKNYDIPIIIYSLNKNTFLSVNIKDETNLITWNFEEACLPEI